MALLHGQLAILLSALDAHLNHALHTAPHLHGDGVDHLDGESHSAPDGVSRQGKGCGGRQIGGHHPLRCPAGARKCHQEIHEGILVDATDLEVRCIGSHEAPDTHSGPTLGDDDGQRESTYGRATRGRRRASLEEIICQTGWITDLLRLVLTVRRGNLTQLILDLIQRPLFVFQGDTRSVVFSQ